jgi:hypothetical protein
MLYVTSMDVPQIDIKARSMPRKYLKLNIKLAKIITEKRT